MGEPSIKANSAPGEGCALKITDHTDEAVDLIQLCCSDLMWEIHSTLSEPLFSCP